MHARQINWAAILSTAAAVVCAWVVFTWYLSLDRINVRERPHQIAWSMVSHALRSEGVPAGVSLQARQYYRLGIQKLGSWCLREFGGTYPALLSYQYAFLFLLLVSIGAFAWRLGGPLAGALAPWLALFAPLTLGLAITPDDQLILQALVCAALALVVWSDQPRTQGLAWLSALPVFIGLHLSAHETNATIMLGTYTVGTAGIIGWQSMQRSQLRLDRKHGLASIPWPVAGGVALIVIVAGYLSLPPASGAAYYQTELANAKYVSIWQDPWSLFSYFKLWFRFMAGPALGAAALISLVVCARYKKGAAAVAGLWFFLPLLVLSLISKRQDWYLFYAAPGSYVLAAVGVMALPQKRFRIGAAIALTALAFFAWVQAWRTVDPQIQMPYRGMFQISAPYIYPPRVNQPSPFAAWVDETCRGPGRRVLFILSSKLYMDRWALPLWHRHADLAPMDFFSKEPPEINARCILMHFERHPPVNDLRAGLALFRQDMQDKYYPNFIPISPAIDSKIAVLEKISDRYRYAGQMDGVSLFVPASGTAN